MKKPVEKSSVPSRSGVSVERMVEHPLTPEELAFISAINAYKKQHDRPFPTWSEVLYVLRSLGYEKRPKDDLDCALEETDPTVRRRLIEGFIHEVKHALRDRTAVYGAGDSDLPRLRERLAVAEQALAVQPG